MLGAFWFLSLHLTHPSTVHVTRMTLRGNRKDFSFEPWSGSYSQCSKPALECPRQNYKANRYDIPRSLSILSANKRNHVPVRVKNLVMF
jgi:hypothetical protein